MQIPDPGYIEFTPERARRVSTLTPFAGHAPHWDSDDCPSCGSAPCGPHPLLLLCDLCAEPYPCGPVWEVAAEIGALGAAGHARAGDLLLGLPVPIAPCPPPPRP